MYEEGHAEEAEKEKLRLEQNQREKLKAMKANSEPWVPKWFEFAGQGEEGTWHYKGGYWEQRGNVPDDLKLWK
jgi:hypothetical protein